MDLIRQYINQCITTAANNLRLNTEKIEVVALIRENLSKTADVEAEIRSMKKVTELSTFAIRLGEIFNYIAKTKIDFFKITDKFKEHSYSLVKDISTLLDKVNPQTFRHLMAAMHEDNHPKSAALEQIVAKTEIITEHQLKTEAKKMTIVEEVLFPQFENKHIEVADRTPEPEVELPAAANVEEQAEPIIFDSYEERILEPIKEIDLFLKNLALNKVEKEEIEKYIRIMEANSILSRKIGFDIIAAMHKIFANSLSLINTKSMPVTKELIGGLRAALIVVVAVVRGKEVDLTGYLNKAEELGRRIENLK